MLALGFNLTAIASIGSAVALLIFMLVTIAHLRVWGGAGQHRLPGLAAGAAAGQFRDHGRAAIDVDLAELLRWPRLRLQGNTGHL